MGTNTYERNKYRAKIEGYTIPKKVQEKIEAILANPKLETKKELQVELRKTMHLQEITMQRDLYTKEEFEGFVKLLESVTTLEELREADKKWMTWAVKKFGSKCADDEEKKYFEFFASKLLDADEEYTREEWYWAYMFEIVNNGGLSSTVATPERRSRPSKLLRKASTK